MQDTIAQSVPIQTLNGDQALIVVGHGDKAEAFAFVRLQVPNDFDVLHGPKRTKKLPEDIFFRFRRQIVDEDAPATTVDGRRITGGGGCSGARNYGTSSQQFSGQRRIPAKPSKCIINV